jgi:hypothetical protein
MRKFLWMTATLALICFFSWTGGYTARIAGMMPGKPPDSRNAAYKANNRVHKHLRDEQGRVRIDYGMFNGQPIQDFFGEDRSLRLQMATYTNDVRANEKGLPVLTLYDRHGNLRQLWRLDGSNQTPLLILKDHEEHNRLIFGLDLEDPKEQPFLVWFGKDGKKNTLFGKF